MWGGGIRDPEFTDPTIWSDTTNGVAILPLADGSSGPGIASFASSVACNAGAVAQVVEMPQYEDAEPFAIEITSRVRQVLDIDVGYGRAFRRVRRTRTMVFDTDRFCLGEAGYAGSVKFQVAASERRPDCFTAPIGQIEVDRFEIFSADPGECPAPGSVLNGEANIDEGGWVFDVETDRPGGFPEAGLAPGVGEAGSDGARIFKPPGSENFAGMYTQVSVPSASSMPSPALRFWWKGKPGWWYYADLGTYPGTRSEIRPLDALIGDGIGRTSTYCLPPRTQGNVVDLSFRTQGGFFADEAELIVDNVEIVSDPRCGDSEDLLDPSFDSAPNRWPGVAILFEEEPSSSVQLINDPNRANPPGAGALELRYASNKARLEAQTWVWVPPSEGNRGPQLVFHSNVPADPGARAFWAFGSTAPSDFADFICTEEFCPLTPLTDRLPLGGGWQRNVACLPPEWAERWFRFRVAIRESEEPQRALDPPRAVLLDDFEVTTDENCPARSGTVAP